MRTSAATRCSFLLRFVALLSAASGGLLAQFHLPGTGPKSDTPASPSTKAQPPTQQTTPPAPAAAAPEKAPGRFDYYVLTFSSRPGRVIVLSFAPHLNSGASPESCGTVKPASKGAVGIVESLMANRAAAQQEWAKHGSCTGLNAVEYFNTLRFARSQVQIPVQLTSPDEDAVPETPQLVESQFVSANPGFPAGAFRTHAADVEICFDLELRPLACPATGSK